MLEKNKLYMKLYKDDKIGIQQLMLNVEVEDFTPEVLIKCISNGDFHDVFSLLIKNEYVITVLLSIKSLNAPTFYAITKYLAKSGNINKLADKVIKFNKASDIYLFAKYFEKAPLKKLEEAIIKTGDVKYIYEFSKEVKNSDELADAIDRLGEPKDKFFYIKYSKDPSENAKYKLAKSIFASEDVIYIKALLIDYTFDMEEVYEGVRILKANNEDVCPILEKYNITDQTFVDEMLNKGLVKTFEKANYTKDFVLSILVNKLPETENLLRVYYRFLTTDMDPEDAKALDIEYKAEVLKTIKKDSKEFLNAFQRLNKGTQE